MHGADSVFVSCKARIFSNIKVVFVYLYPTKNGA